MDVPSQLSAALTGRYAIERQVGAGGMATVYLARDLKHQRNVALKVLRAELSAILGPERFLTEIQVTANLQHAHILPLFDSGDANGLLYYVMPFVEGETLRHRLEREGQLRLDDALHIARAVASALDYAHRRGVIHRDLKPENILLHDNEPLVADFGIALAVNSAGGDRLTQTGISLGTPEYMSPEQATGDRRTDGRSDIYALGAVLYEMLVGEPPHAGKSLQAIIAKVLTERPQFVRTFRETVPEHIDSAVQRALARLPADRFATAGEFADVLTSARISTEPAQVVPPRKAFTVARLRSWTPWVLSAAVSGIALAGLLRPTPTGPLARFEIVLPDSMPLLDRWPVVSPDGSHIVYAAGADSALYVRRLDATESRRIAGTEKAYPQCISADGTWLVFVSGGALRKVPLAGGAPVDIVTPWGGARCSDRDELLYSPEGSLWRISLNGGTPALVARPDTTRRHRSYDFTSVLPGGRVALITISKGADDVGLGLVRLGDGMVTELGISGSNAQYVRTGHIVFGRADGSILAAPFSPRRKRVTGPLITVNEPVPTSPTYKRLSPTGTLAYVTPSTQPTRMVRVDRSGKASDFADRVDMFVSPRLSPDGRRVALTMETNPRREVWIYDIASNTFTPLADAGAGDVGRLEWTRDGRRVAFTTARLTPDGAMGIRWRAWDGSEPAEMILPRDLAVFALSMGPPHTYMVFEQGAVNRANLWIAPLDSLQQARPFLITPEDELAPRISPSGRLLAYTSNKSGRQEVYITPLPGPGAHLAVSEGGGTEPVWSRDGARLYYRGPMHLLSAVIAETPELSFTRRDTLFPDTYSRALAHVHASYDVFPDGEHFLMMRPEKGKRARLFVVVNWAEQLRRK